jgi:NAD+ diphosphatase
VTAARCFAFRGAELLVAGESIPSEAALAAAGLPIGDPVPVAADAVAVALPEDTRAPEGLILIDLWDLGDQVDRGTWRLAGRAYQLVEWQRAHMFCGRCGGPTQPHDRETAKVCTECCELFFPRLNPAVIVLIEHQGKLLLARSPHFPPGMYSAIAGFVEPGETLEETVAREVREEVGVEVADVRYFGSQQWPFPSSLMLGFTARYAGGELRLEDPEVADARWFGPDDLPVLPPPISIARDLIEDFLARARVAR